MNMYMIVFLGTSNLSCYVIIRKKEGGASLKETIPNTISDIYTTVSTFMSVSPSNVDV